MGWLAICISASRISVLITLFLPLSLLDLAPQELKDEQKEYIDIQFKDGTFAPILRGFATSVSMSYDGTRAAVAGRFGDEFHVFERDTEENFTKAEWKVFGGVIPMLHSHMGDNYEELEDHQSDVALSGDGNVVACGYPYYLSLIHI